MSIKNNTTSLQSLLELVNALPDAGGGGVELPELTNEGTASDLLSGKQLIDGDGNVVTGTIQTKTASDLMVSGSTVTVPSGYYASGAIQSVYIASRANTTMSTTVDDTNDKITITASNNQESGYVTGSNKTATKVISLSASGATVTASDGTNKVSKSVSTATQATPNISVDANGKITANSTQAAGYVQAGTKSATKQLTTQAAKTITPTKSSQTAVSSGVYTIGAINVAPIPSEYVVTTDATASADEIMSGETAYVNGSKITGSFTLEEELSEQDLLIAQIASALEGKAGGGGSNDEVMLGVAYAAGEDYALCRPIIFQMGATWQEFINSEYNKIPVPDIDVTLTNSYRAYENYVENAQRSYYHISNDKTSSGRVKLTDVIESGKIYRYYYDD